MTREQIEDFVNGFLEDEDDFEGLLINFDLDPVEVFLFLFESGMIDEELLKEMAGY